MIWLRSIRALIVLIILGAATSRPDKRCRKPRIPPIRVTSDNIVDLTYDFDENSVVWPSRSMGFQLLDIFKGFIKPFGFFYSDNTYSSPAHLGTHMDSPIHFAEHGLDASEVRLANLIGQGVLLNLVKNGQSFEKDSLFTIDHFRDWERKHGIIKPGSIVLVRTGYGENYYNRTAYFGTDISAPNATQNLHFPGYDPEAAQWLINKRCVVAVGLDTASVDRGQSRDFQAHQVLGKSNIPVFENVANLDKLVNEQFTVIALPMKVRGGTGAPLRIIAVVQ